MPWKKKPAPGQERTAPRARSGGRPPAPQLPAGETPSGEVWDAFVRFVAVAGVVRTDLLQQRKDHWEIIWHTFRHAYVRGAESCL